MFALEINVAAFVTTDSHGTKTYTNDTVLKWEMEIGSLSLDLLMTSLSKELKWGSNQSASVWFFDKRIGEEVKLDNEIQMIDMFDMYKSELSCTIIVGIFDKVVVDHAIEHEFDDLEPLCVLPPDAPIHAAPNEHESNLTGAGVSASEVAVETEVPTAKEADASVPDIFDNEEEYVGVNDEHIYMPPLPAQEPTQPSQPAHAEVPCPPANSDGPSIVNAEPEINDADPEALHVHHDPENPRIEKGALFPDIISFRKAVRHYAIVKGFKFADLKTDTTRFIAKCAHPSCPWRIHASRVQGKRTIEVY